MEQPTKQAFGPAVNRIADVMAHISRYAFQGSARLAEDADVNASSVSRLIHGKMNPSFLLVARVTHAIEAQLGFRIDPRDLVAESCKFLTPFVCELCRMSPCLPDIARDECGELKHRFVGVNPGEWVCSRYPKGMTGKEGL